MANIEIHVLITVDWKLLGPENAAEFILHS